MALALGIDTGGTYTDSVIFDLNGGKAVVKAKAITTYDDLTRGINEGSPAGGRGACQAMGGKSRCC